MKKSLIAAGTILLVLTGCTAPKAEMHVQDGAYSLTPQEYIDRINATVDAQGDSRYLSIPDFQASGDEIEIDFIYLTVQLSTNESGNLTEIYYTWDWTQSGIGENLGLYLGCTFSLLGIDDVNGTYDALDMMDTSYAGYETTYTENGTLFSYSMIGHGQFNYLTITPADTKE